MEPGASPNPEFLRLLVERLRALADEGRIRLLLRLRQGEANVSELVQATGIGQASVSKHLSVLRRVGIVACRRAGTQAIYRIKDESVFGVCQVLCDGVRRHHEELAGTALGGGSFEI